MSGSQDPYWHPYAFHPDGRPLFVGHPPNTFPTSAQPNFSPHAPPPQFPFYPVHDAAFAAEGVHQLIEPGAFATLDAPQERKHRRSRNGCFTCRTRRVKCDEKRPSCDRCRKGCRECVYPSPSETPRKKLKQDRDAPREDGHSPDADESASPPGAYSSAPDLVRDSASETTGSTASTSVSPKVAESRSPPLLSRMQHSASRLSSTRIGGPSYATSPSSTLTAVAENSGGDKDYDYYLEYTRSHLTHHNYGLSHPAPDLIPNFLLAQARSFKPLLHAVTAFAAYVCALQEEDASLKDFIFHYAESVADLRGYLLEKRSAIQINVLLTILQLATIEEYLGDWVNLINHQMAARKVMTNIWTAQTIMEDVNGRYLLNWYNHFDLFTSYMGGRGTALGREWFQAPYDFWQTQAEQNPDVLDYQYLLRHARLRLVGADLAIFFSELTSGKMSLKAVETAAIDFKNKLFRIIEEAGPLTDPSKQAQSSPSPPGQVHPSGQVHSYELHLPATPENEDLGDPWDSTVYYREPLWSTNYLVLRCYGMYMMLLNQFSAHSLQYLRQTTGEETASIFSPPVSPSAVESDSMPLAITKQMKELRRYAVKQCQLFAALCNHDPNPAAIIACQAALSYSSCFLSPVSDSPKAALQIQWVREQLSRVECYGYIYPRALRKRLSDAWGVDVTDWWFPEGQGLNETLKAVREFVVFRTRIPEDDLSEDVREMNGLFADLKVGEDTGSNFMDKDESNPG